MQGWKRYLAMLLLPLTVCGLMLLVASTAKQVATELRWTFRLLSMLLLAPGVVLMLLSVPILPEDADQDEGYDSVDLDSCPTRLDA
jgi:hypothetical protein